MKHMQLSRAHGALMSALEQGIDPLRHLAMALGRNLRGPPMRVCRIDQRPTEVDWRSSRHGSPIDAARSRGSRDRTCG